MGSLTEYDDPSKISWEYRCKICQLAKSHPELFKELHAQVLEVGNSQNRAMIYINDRIEKMSLPISKLNNQNMSAHFSNHINMPDRVNMEVAKSSHTLPEITQVTAGNDAGRYVEDMVRRKVGNEVGDYLNLDELRVRLMEKMEVLDRVIEKNTDDGKVIVDFEALQLYTKLTSEIRGIIVDLNKIRQSRQLLNTIMKQLMERCTMDIMRQLMREYEQIKLDLIQSGVTEQVATKISQQLRTSAASIIAMTARAVLGDVMRTYKLGT